MQQLPLYPLANRFSAFCFLASSVVLQSLIPIVAAKLLLLSLRVVDVDCRESAVWHFEEALLGGASRMSPKIGSFKMQAGFSIKHTRSEKLALCWYFSKSSRAIVRHLSFSLYGSLAMTSLKTDGIFKSNPIQSTLFI